MCMCLIIMRNGSLNATLHSKMSVDGQNSSIHKEFSVNRNIIQCIHKAIEQVNTTGTLHYRKC